MLTKTKIFKIYVQKTFARSFDKSKINIWLKKYDIHVLSIVETNFQTHHKSLFDVTYDIYMKKGGLMVAGGVAMFVNQMLNNEKLNLKAYII